MPEHLGNSNKLQMASAHAMTLITWTMALPGKFQAWIEGFQAAPLHVRLRSMRWAALPAAVLLASIHQAAVYLLSGESIPGRSLILSLLLYSLVGGVLVWTGMMLVGESVQRSAEAEARLRAAYAELENNHQKLLTLHELGQRLASVDHLQEALELASQAPLKLANARASTVVTFNDEHDRLSLDMAWGLSQEYLSALRQRIDQGIPAERCRVCSTLHAQATQDCPLFDGLQPLAKQEGLSSLICLPILDDQERVGIISAYFPSPDGPPEDQIRLLNILGGAVAVVIDSLRARVRQVETFYSLDQAAQATNLLGDFCSQVLDIVTAGWDAQVGGIFLIDEKTQEWNSLAERGFEQERSEPRYQFALDLVQRAALMGQTLIQADLSSETQLQLGSAAAAPLMTEGRVLGAIFLGSVRRRALVERHRELLHTMAHQTALAIRNAQLYVQVEQMAILEERFRLSREIHDGLAQTLGFLGLQAERLEKLLAAGKYESVAQELVEMRQAIQAAYQDAREAIDGLRQRPPDPDDLVNRLRQLTKDYTHQTSIDVLVEDRSGGVTVDPAISLQLLRVTQEALTNVRKHAHASRVTLIISARDGELELSISDNGRGFPAEEQSSSRRRSFGLASMRERVDSLGGSLTIATGPEQGTRLTVAVPLRSKR